MDKNERGFFQDLYVGIHLFEELSVAERKNIVNLEADFPMEASIHIVILERGARRRFGHR